MFSAWPVAPFQIPLPNYPDVFFVITQILPGGTRQQLRWLLSVLQDLRIRVLADTEPRLKHFSTETTEIVFSQVTEVQTSMPLKGYVRTRMAIVESLEVLKSIVIRDNAAQLAGYFSFKSGVRFAYFEAKFASTFPVIPHLKPIAGSYPLGGGLTALRITQGLGMGDGWDAKHCSETLDVIIEQFSKHSSIQGDGFSVMTGGPGEWKIAFEISAASQMLRLLNLELAMLSKLRDLIRQHGVGPMEFSLYSPNLHREHGQGWIEPSTLQFSNGSRVRDLALNDITA